MLLNKIKKNILEEVLEINTIDTSAQEKWTFDWKGLL